MISRGTILSLEINGVDCTHLVSQFPPKVELTFNYYFKDELSNWPKSKKKKKHER